MSRLLVVVDVQNDFVDGVLGCQAAQDIIPNIKAKIAEYDNGTDFIIYTMDTHNKNYLETQEGRNLPVPHCIQGSRGWHLVDDILPNGDNYEVIYKTQFGYPYWVIFVQNNPSIDEIEVIGIDTAICVLSNITLIKAQAPEVPIKVDARCCASSNPEWHEAAFKVMEAIQVEVVR